MFRVQFQYPSDCQSKACIRNSALWFSQEALLSPLKADGKQVETCLIENEAC